MNNKDQTLISNFFLQRNPPYIRKYGDLVEELIQKAQKAFSKDKDKENAKQDNIEEEVPKNKEALKKKVKMSYKKYTLDQKKAIVELLDHMLPLDVEREFGVDESTARNWKRDGAKKDRRINNGKTPILGHLEQGLYKILLEKRENGVAVTSRVIFKEMENKLTKLFSLVFKKKS